MSDRYEKARAIAEAAANRWNAFGDTAGVNWLTDAIMALPAAKPFDPDPAFEPCAGITTNPALLEALKRAAAHEMTPSEKHAQRRSWIIGEMGIEHPEMSREELEALADHAVGPAPAAETPHPDQTPKAGD